MPRAKSDKIKIEILKDGVFIADDVRADKGERHEVEASLAKAIIANGHAK